MGLLDLFRQRRVPSAAVAKERLQILVAHERRERNSPSYMPRLKEDLLQVIRKYVAVEQDAVQVTLESDGSNEVLELNVVLPAK
jgi:cell division topological specificity factor